MGKAEAGGAAGAGGAGVVGAGRGVGGRGVVTAGFGVVAAGVGAGVVAVGGGATVAVGDGDWVTVAVTERAALGVAFLEQAVARSTRTPRAAIQRKGRGRLRCPWSMQGKFTVRAHHPI